MAQGGTPPLSVQTSSATVASATGGTARALRVVLTGASSGIGRATAVALAAQGHRLTLVSRNLDALRETAGLFTAGAMTPRLVSADLRRVEGLIELMEDAHRAMGGLDVLINCAGMALSKTIVKTTDAEMLELMTVNALAPAALMRGAFAVWQREPGGAQRVVVNVCSMAAIDPYPGFHAYAASKAALASLSLTASREGEAMGVRVFCLCPGDVDTPMREAVRAANRSLPECEAMSAERVAARIIECLEPGADSMGGRAIAVVA